MHFPPLELRNKMNKKLCIMQGSKWLVPNKWQSVEFRRGGDHWGSDFNIFPVFIISIPISPDTLSNFPTVYLMYDRKCMDMFLLNKKWVLFGFYLLLHYSKCIECNDFVSAKLRDQEYFFF